MSIQLPSLTPNEKAILIYIVEFIDNNDLSPTYMEIQKAFGYASVNSVQNYVRQLERKGYIHLEPHQKRAIQVADGAFQYSSRAKVSLDGATEVAIQAKVAAGGPIEYAVHDRSVMVDSALLPKNGSFFAVEVAGDSMIEAGILSGDVMILTKVRSIYPGMTAVVSIEDEGATVKKVYPHISERMFELRPANSQYQSRFVKESDTRFEGQLVALVRKY